MKKGFTLLELIVVVSIIILISTILLVNFRGSEKYFALQRSSHKLAQDLRKAQGMAMAAQEFKGAFQGGFGIHFVVTPGGQDTGSYILFVDCNNNKIFDGSSVTTCDDCRGASCISDIFSEEVEIISLERGIKINNLLPTAPTDIVFIPPDPTVFINSSPDINSASITLTFDEKTTKGVSVNKAGLINIE